MEMSMGIDFLSATDYIRPFQDPIFLRFFTALLLIKISHESSESDVKALLAIKLHLNSPALADWTGNNPCHWTGIKCGGSDNVVTLSLPKSNLTGTLDPAMGNLSSLTKMDLSENYLFGPIPSEMRNCHRLQVLNISGNNFDGDLSVFSYMSNLTVLDVAKNDFSGSIPRTIGKLNYLQVLHLSKNRFVEKIPDEIGNCTVLHRLCFSGNNLTGGIPSSIFKMQRLQYLCLSDNQLSGDLPVFWSTLPELKVLCLARNEFSGLIPPFLSNLTKLTVLALSSNKLTGPIPTGLGNLSAVTLLCLNANGLTGLIPTELGKMSSLTQLALKSNNLTGPIPPELFDCRNLSSLLLGGNQLNSSIPREIGGLSFLRELDLTGNQLTGSIPVELGNCQLLSVIDLSKNNIVGELPPHLATPNLTRLYLGSNRLTGSISSDYTALQSIEYIDLSNNHLSGTIPNNFSDSSSLLSLQLARNQLTGSLPISIVKLRTLQVLDVRGNQLTGNLGEFSVDYAIGNSNASQLQHLLLSENNFTGEFPASWTSCMKSLLTLDLHGNKLRGSIPAVIGDLFLVQSIDLSSNEFEGPIPAEIGICSFLTSLNLSSNRLAGEIPSHIADAWALDATVQVVVDFSSNNLSGEIPDSLNLSNLTLNVSNNDLRGPIPSHLQNLSKSNFRGNPSMCGPPLSFPCPQMAGNSAKARIAVRVVVLLAFCGFVAVATALGLAFLVTKLNWRRSAEVEPGLDGPSVVIQFLDGTWLGETCSNAKSAKKRPEMKLTFADLFRATGGFSPANIIGDGGFGKVYKGHLPDGTIVAIKKLTEDGYQGEREFIAELETLGKLRHKNLVQLFAFCSKNSERLLVYEYMPNDSLDFWLHSRTEGMEPLSWELRMIIAKDVARGLTFLHHFCVPKVIHRDLKASNILLDTNFNARLADFGLARHLNTYESHVSTAVAGSLGYIAPEYARCWRVTTRGDVFGFGIVLLELLSGQRPASGLYKPIHGGNLVGWVQHLLSTHQISDHFFDETLGSVRGSGLETQMMAALNIAMQCTQEIPSKRPTMLEVLRILEESF